MFLFVVSSRISSRRLVSHSLYEQTGFLPQLFSFRHKQTILLLCSELTHNVIFAANDRDLISRQYYRLNSHLLITKKLQNKRIQVKIRLGKVVNDALDCRGYLQELEFFQRLSTRQQILAGICAVVDIRGRGGTSWEVSI